MNLPQFTAEASLDGGQGHHRATAALVAADEGDRVTPALVGRWSLQPVFACELVCIEVCTRFCHPTGWDCCTWETRCALNCDGARNPVVNF